MKVYLIQHGKAKNKDEDPTRPLTDEGKTQSSKMAEFLKGTRLKPEVIYHSNKERSVETAKIFAEILNPQCALEEREDLGPNDEVNKMWKIVMTESKDVMIVGHLPYLQKLSSLLLFDSESEDCIEFQNSGVFVFSKTKEERWQLCFALPPNI